MTQEQKAKRYDEVLTNARMFYKDEHVSDDANNLLEALFPELAESKDERIRKVIYGWIYTQPSQFFDNGFSKEEMLAWIEKQGQKPIDPDTLIQQRADALADMVADQKPAWSEEDETGLTNTIIMLKEGASLHFTKEDITKAVDWLKSLRPKNTWKPSEEQLKSLQEVIDVGHFTSYPNSLETLYEQLKKLKG